jgi:hypothetical protein
MYDYNNGRFLSVDPFIQSPTSTQSMNPYTYIFNNPLSGTDPSGYIVQALIYPIIQYGGRKAVQQVAKSVAKSVGKVVTRAAQAASAYYAARIAQQSVEFTITCDSSCNTQNPGFDQAETEAQVLTNPVADPQSSTLSQPIADPSPTSMEGPALDSGEQNKNQGIMTNQNSGDTSETESQNSKPVFEIDKNGTTDSIRNDLESAGYSGEATTETLENGTLHKGVLGSSGEEMDVKVMDGQSNGKEFKGPRVNTYRAGTKDPSRTDGSKFKKNESKAQRQQESHVHLKDDKTVK